ncbi:hypothetical protein [Allobaculum sp. JKK-2023]|uniref:hypothetical protein n=1 Tax=Allobaculum sp. JKK-2023 TaxID=3108943 RepID=UPI002B061ADE|nr:hypothetical protein [Allobaculum sp. JKK-2023]
MKYLILIKPILIILLSAAVLIPPKYCPIHKTVDFCYKEQIDKNGGLGQSDH